MDAALSDAYENYMMCTHLYRCLPSELANESAAVVDLHWRMYQAELKHDEDVRKAQKP